eukprot:gene10093-7988_t
MILLLKPRWGEVGGLGEVEWNGAWRALEAECRLVEADAKILLLKPRALEAETRLGAVTGELAELKGERDVLKRALERAQDAWERSDAQQPQQQIVPSHSSPNIIVNIPGIGQVHQQPLNQSAPARERPVAAAADDPLLPPPMWGNRAAGADPGEMAALQKLVAELKARNLELEAENARLRAQVEDLQRRFNESRPCRGLSQLDGGQLALRGSQKEVDRLAAELEKQPAFDPPTPTPAPVGKGAPDPAQQQRMQQLEGALKQATMDYQLLLQEVSKIKSDLEHNDRLLSEQASKSGNSDALRDELEYYKSEVARLQALLQQQDMRIAQLTRQLSDCEAHRRKFERRLAEAKMHDDRYNQARDSPPPSPSPPMVPQRSGGSSSRRPEKIRYCAPGGF